MPISEMAMKIHFIYCDVDSGFYPGAHHGLASLFAAVRAAGHDYALTHLTKDIPCDEFANSLPAADVYAFSAMTNQFKFVRRLAPVVAGATGKPVVVGGVHAMLEGPAAAQVEGVTCAFTCEADVALPTWLSAYQAGEWRGVGGIAYAQDGQTRCNPAAPILDLDSLPEPTYDGFDMRRILRDLGGRLSVTVSRGCPYSCAFCCNEALRRNFGAPGYARRRSPSSAVAMVKNLAERYKPDSIRFEDDLLLVSRQWREEFLSLFREQIGLPMECNCRADLVDAGLADLLKKSGCVSLDIGVESGDESLRNKVLNKGVSDEQLIRAFDLLNSRGLSTYAYNIVGLPGETAQMAEKTYRLNRRLRPSAGAVFYFYPYPHTALAEYARRESLFRDDYEQANSYTNRPSVLPTHMSYRQMRSVYRRLRMHLLLRRFVSFFALPRGLKKIMAAGAWGIFLACPPLIEILLTDSALKRWLRRQAFRVRGK